MNILVYAHGRTGSGLIVDALGLMSGIKPTFFPSVPEDTLIIKTHEARRLDEQTLEIVYVQDGDEHWMPLHMPNEEWVFVHLFRSNKLRQAISLVKAMQSGGWWYDASLSDFVYTYSRSAIQNEMMGFVKRDARRFRFFEEQSVRQMQVCYELFIESPTSMEETTRRILNLAELPICEPSLSGLARVRQYDAVSALWERCFIAGRDPTDEELAHLGQLGQET